MENKTLFEIRHRIGDSFKLSAELFTPEGYFVKYDDMPNQQVINTIGDMVKTESPLKIGNATISRNTFHGCRIGIWIKKNGSFALATT